MGGHCSQGESQSSPGRSRSSGQYETNNSIAKDRMLAGSVPGVLIFSASGGAARPKRLLHRQAAGPEGGVTMISPGETEAGSAGMQPRRGITWAHRDDDRSVEARASALCKTPIGSVDPYALKIPARRAEWLLHDTTPQSPLTATEHSRSGSNWPAEMAPSPAAANTFGNGLFPIEEFRLQRRV